MYGRAAARGGVQVTAARKVATCLVCGKTDDKEFVVHLQIAAARAAAGAARALPTTAHRQDCSSKVLDERFLRELVDAWSTAPEEARAAMKKLGKQVTRASRYLPHEEVCHQLAAARAGRVCASEQVYPTQEAARRAASGGQTGVRALEALDAAVAEFKAAFGIG